MPGAKAPLSFMMRLPATLKGSFPRLKSGASTFSASHIETRFQTLETFEAQTDSKLLAAPKSTKYSYPVFSMQEVVSWPF